MRLWHDIMIPFLPKNQLLGENRECCALRGLGWYKKHSTVSYVFQHNYLDLYNYHKKIMLEMIRRKYKVKNEKWRDSCYRGRRMQYVEYNDLPNIQMVSKRRYKEHNDVYLKDCITNLSTKMQKEPWKYKKEDFDRFNSFLVMQEALIK